MMKIGIESGAYIDRYGFSEGIRRMKKHGYECLDYQSFCDTEIPLYRCSEHEFERQLLAMKEEAATVGIEISQTHGPWRWPPQDYTEEQRAERFEKMSKAIRGTAILGCKHFIIHPIMPFGDNQDPDPQRLWDMNIEFMSRLVAVGKEYQVVVNYENMPMLALSNSRPEAILRAVREINSPFFKVCLDTGHCAVFGDSPADAVRLIGKEYLSTLHVHDNDGHGDRHWLPYTGVIDWDDFSDALAEIGYEGVVSLETAVPGNLVEPEREQAEIALYNTAKRIARR